MANPADPAPQRDVAAVVLAAGSSRRFGEANKLLAEVAGRPLIFHSVSAFTSSRASDVVVVTGPDQEAIRSALDGLPVRFVHNADHLSGMGSSIAAGVAAIDAGKYGGVLICPGDMPGMTSRFIDTLIDAFAASDGDHIIRPVLRDGRPAHPVLWPARLFATLRQLTGPEGGRRILEALAADVVTIKSDSRDAALDIDTRDELDALRDRLHKQHSS